VHPLLRFRLPLILLGVVIVFGVSGYMLVNSWDLLDAFYMTIITISTVGYGEVHPQGAPQPNGNLKLEEGDLVIALGTEDQLFASAALLR
jgi:hypothetical protein